MEHSKEFIAVKDMKTTESSPILISKVQQIKNVDLLSFYRNNINFKGKRFFWKDSSTNNVIIGIGICSEIKSEKNSGLYEEVEEKWKELLRNSEIHNSYPYLGIGPLLFGGFSFDPAKSKTPLWNNFSNAQFYLPTYMLSEIDGSHYLTINHLVKQEDKLTVADEILKKRQTFLDHVKNTAVPSNENTFIKAVEVGGEAWKNTVSTVIQDLNDSLKKVVFARECRLQFEKYIEEDLLLKNLMEEQKNCYIFALESKSDSFIGASPERLIKKEGNEVFSACVAGSISRGKNLEKDKQLEELLLADEKNRVEHDYVVQMIQDAMKLVCQQVEIPSKPQIMKTRDIQHLYTPVKGILKETESLLSLIKLLHPTPALGGFPQQLALEKIREKEELDRGFYGGPIGWYDYRGNGEFAVSIRSGLIQNNEASIFAGCGIVKSSDVEEEYKETAIKFKPMLSALGGRLQ